MGGGQEALVMEPERVSRPTVAWTRIFITLSIRTNWAGPNESRRCPDGLQISLICTILRTLWRAEAFELSLAFSSSVCK